MTEDATLAEIYRSSRAYAFMAVVKRRYLDATGDLTGAVHYDDLVAREYAACTDATYQALMLGLAGDRINPAYDDGRAEGLADATSMTDTEIVRAVRESTP